MRLFVPWFFVDLSVTALLSAGIAPSVAASPVSRIKLDTPTLAPMGALLLAEVSG